jgi:hypothetical protein
LVASKAEMRAEREHDAELDRLRAENARLAREAHTWWTACANATKEIEWLTQEVRRLRDDVSAERDRCALVAALHSQYPVTTDYDRGYAKARADAAAAIRRRGE